MITINLVGMIVTGAGGLLLGMAIGFVYGMWWMATRQD